MIRSNLNYNLKPQTLVNNQPQIETGNTNETKVKPSLQNMNDLYKLYNEAKMVFFPAAAFAKCIKNRTEALEKYIKDNNLNIESVQNLESFLAEVKDKTSRKILLSDETRDLMFNSYIENGYEQNTSLESMADKLIEKYQSIKIDKNLEFQSPLIKTILEDNIEKITEIFPQEDEKTEETNGKPSLQDLRNLYKLYSEAKIVPFPAAAFAKCIKNRTEALEKYIKDNNLNIESVQNLESFLAEVKDKTSRKMLLSDEIQDLMFNRYIKNGYEQNTRLESMADESRKEFQNINEEDNLESQKSTDDVQTGENPAVENPTEENPTEENLKNIEEKLKNAFKNKFIFLK